MSLVRRDQTSTWICRCPGHCKKDSHTITKNDNVIENVVITQATLETEMTPTGPVKMDVVTLPENTTSQKERKSPACVEIPDIMKRDDLVDLPQEVQTSPGASVIMDVVVKKYSSEIVPKGAVLALKSVRQLKICLNVRLQLL